MNNDAPVRQLKSDFEAAKHIHDSMNLQSGNDAYASADVVLTSLANADITFEGGHGTPVTTFDIWDFGGQQVLIH